MTLVTHPATIKNDSTITLPQDLPHLPNQTRHNYSQYLASLFVSTVFAFGVGCGLAATEVTDQPAAVTAALLKEVI